MKLQRVLMGEYEYLDTRSLMMKLRRLFKYIKYIEIVFSIKQETLCGGARWNYLGEGVPTSTNSQ